MPLPPLSIAPELHVQEWLNTNDALTLAKLQG
jgi:hypothetical protein